MDITLKKAICFTTNGYVLNRNITSTGFCFESDMLQNDVTPNIAEHYWLNAQVDNAQLETVYSINRYLNFPLTEVTALSSQTIYTGLEKLPLGKSESLEMSLDKALKRRKTDRKYTGDFVPLSYVSALLRAAAGVTHTFRQNDSVRSQRACASGGGLYPVKLYLFANKIRNITRGIYIYDSMQDALFGIEKSPQPLNDFLKTQTISDLPNIQDVAFILFFTLEPWKSLAKYGAVGLRFSLIEVGEMAQNLHLAATCLGVGSCAYASFEAKAVCQLLRIDGDYETFQHSILFGISTGDV